MQLSFSRFDDDVARFIITGFSSAFVNSYRRTMIGEVPTLAIEDVHIYDNNSALFDEMLAHRLGGLIPPSGQILMNMYSPRIAPVMVRGGVQHARLFIH